MRRLAQRHATPSEPVAVESSTAPTEARRSRWPWVIGLSTAAASLCVALIAVGVIIGRGNDTGSTHAAAPLTAIRSSARKAAPPNANHDFPGPGEALDGSYRVESIANSRPTTAPPTRNHQTSAPGGLSELRAHPILRGHRGPARRRRPRKLSAAGGQKPVVLDFRNGAWQSRPETMLFACLGPDGAPAKQTTTQVIWLQHAQGALRGTVTVTVESNECSQQGATIEIPAVAARVAEVPAGVEVPSPPSGTPPAPAPTTPPR